MTQAIVDRCMDPTAQELLAQFLASDEPDGKGQKLAKARLLAALTDAEQGVC